LTPVNELSLSNRTDHATLTNGEGGGWNSVNTGVKNISCPHGVHMKTPRNQPQKFGQVLKRDFPEVSTLSIASRTEIGILPGIPNCLLQYFRAFLRDNDASQTYASTHEMGTLFALIYLRVKPHRETSTPDSTRNTSSFHEHTGGVILTCGNGQQRKRGLVFV